MLLDTPAEINQIFLKMVIWFWVTYFYEMKLATSAIKNIAFPAKKNFCFDSPYLSPAHFKSHWENKGQGIINKWCPMIFDNFWPPIPPNVRYLPFNVRFFGDISEPLSPPP